MGIRRVAFFVCTHLRASAWAKTRGQPVGGLGRPILDLIFSFLGFRGRFAKCRINELREALLADGVVRLTGFLALLNFPVSDRACYQTYTYSAQAIRMSRMAAGFREAGEITRWRGGMSAAFFACKSDG